MEKMTNIIHLHLLSESIFKTVVKYVLHYVGLPNMEHVMNIIYMHFLSENIQKLKYVLGGKIMSWENTYTLARDT